MPAEGPLMTMDYRFQTTLESARAGAGGVSASLKSNSIGAPPIARAGSPEFKARVLPEILSGQKISALAITACDSSFGAGFDAANAAPAPTTTTSIVPAP